MEPTILIVDDDDEFQFLLTQRLQAEGFRTRSARDGPEAIQELQLGLPDLILLDVLMPRMDGWETCHRIRQACDVPIVILSVRDGDSDKVRGLDLGADDYVSKTASRAELVARIRAALRRGRRRLTGPGLARVDERLALDGTTREVVVDGRRLPLTGIEYRLLSCFVANAGHVLTHRSLLAQVWGWEYVDDRDYLKVFVHHLRAKIEPDPRRPIYILTERGVGYRFQVPGPR